MASVKLNSLTKTFGEITAVDNMDLEIKDKEFFVLLGPTGAGKTTTLRLVSGLEKADKGDIYIDDILVNEHTPALRDVAFVFQYYTLYPHYTVRENLAFPLKSNIRRMSRQDIDKKIEEVAKVLHIEHLLDRETVNLSGGEMQRVAIGRAFVRTPKVFLMDEPLSNLDAKLREEMRAELARLHFNMGFTFFYVTHDQIEAMSMGDRIAVLNEGKLLQVGTPDEMYNKPQNAFVAKFVGTPIINLLDANISNNTLIVEEKAMVCSVSDEQCSLLQNYNKHKLILGIRAEDVEITREGRKENSFRCSVYFKQSMGAEDILNLKINGTIFRAISPPRLMIKVGETVYANINIARAHLFDRDTEKRIR